MPELTTPTARFIAVLQALAAHLRLNPGLCLTQVSGIESMYGNPRTRLQLLARHGDELPDVVAWARSLGGGDVLVKRHHEGETVHLHVRGELPGGISVEAWDSVPALNATDLTDGAVLSVDDLVQIAADTAARVAADAVLAGAR